MSEEKIDKIVYICTKWKDDPELATLPFVLANAAQTMDVKAVVVLQKDAVWLATPNGADEIHANELPPLKDLVNNFIANGGTMLVCTPCMRAYKITPEMLRPEAETIAAARVNLEMLSASAVVSY